jgi:glycosyltransferase involved in cell wall biosynthesis
VKALLATSGRFHTFALARELHARAALGHIVTGFPWFAVARENLPRSYVSTTPWAQMLNFATKRIGLSGPQLDQRMLLEAFRSVDRVALKLVDQADALIALSGSGLQTGKAFRERGKPYICDRGSSHILHQQQILNEEADLNGVPRPFFSPAIVERELREYEASTAVTVPSRFSERSFSAHGLSATKIRRIPYGVNLSHFHPTSLPDSDRFDIIFVGSLCLRKGLSYLLKAFSKFRHPRKRLTLVGVRTPETVYFDGLLAQDGVRVLGTIPHLQLKNILSTSHVMVLPSVEDGFGLVMAEALACGCPVIATENTGAEDLFTDGQEGFVVPIRSATAISDKLQTLADHPALRETMSRAAIARTTSFSGWTQYGDRFYGLLRELAGASPKAPAGFATMHNAGPGAQRS